jgi:hypothetical protein
LFDELLPLEVCELPRDLVALDQLPADRRMLAPIRQAWAQTAPRHDRPASPMASFMRLMVVKHRTGWGYDTLVRINPTLAEADIRYRLTGCWSGRAHRR